MNTEWSIQEIARFSGTTSRTLRHYDDLGLLPPQRIGDNGYRYYGADQLVRLQRILLLRELGLGLPAIGEVLGGEQQPVPALRVHLELLREEKERLDRRIGSVEQTIGKLEGGEQLMAEEAFDGFDNSQYRDEVEQRWGKDAYARSNAWWTSMNADEKKAWQARQKQLAADWMAAAASGARADGAEAQRLAQRQYDWLKAIPGTPGYPDGPTAAYFAGLGELYATDDRFAANYGGPANAAFVRDAMKAYAAALL